MGQSHDTLYAKPFQDLVLDGANGRRPRRGLRFDQICFGLQDDAAVDHLQPVGLEGRTTRGDVDDQFGGTGGGRAFGGAEAFDDAVVADAVKSEMAPRQIGVLGRNPHAALMLAAECHRDLVEVFHAAHVDPARRHGDDDIGVTEAELLEKFDPPFGIGDFFADEVLAGDAEMDAAGAQRIGDFRRRNEGDLDVAAYRRFRRDSRARCRSCAPPCRRRPAFQWSPPSDGPWRGSRI